MGKKSRRKVKVVKEQMPYVVRTFAGLPGECDLIALREMVPAATGTLKLRDSDRVIRMCSLLPGATPGIVRPDGEIWVGLQVTHNFGDISRDLAHVVELALEIEPGNPVVMDDPGVGPRLQDLVDDSVPFAVEVHAGFDFWMVESERTNDTEALLESANNSADPTTRLTSVEAAYWTVMGGRTFLRWVMPEDEDQILNALARLHVRGESSLGEGNRLIGMFRTHALLVPVWELPTGVTAADVEQPAAEFKQRLDEALADTTALTAEERSARSGLASRQLTIR